MVPLFEVESDFFVFGTFQLNGFFKRDSHFATFAESSLNFSRLAVFEKNLFPSILLNVYLFWEQIFDDDSIVVDNPVN